MGEMIGDTPEAQTKIQRDQAISSDPGKISTDVQDVFADGVKNNMPVFNVTPQEFNQNMQHGRKRVRFKQGTSAQQYMSKTRYTKPFWVMDNKNGFIRKIK